MGEFFKQLIAQVSAIWEKLSLQQRIVITALVGFMFFGLFGLAIWSGNSGGSSSGGGAGMKNLFSNIAPAEMAQITEQLDKDGIKYELRYNGTAIYVPSDKLYKARMDLAKEGLPETKGTGYELFDKVDLGATDFEQKVKMKRAIEGELTRTIESLKEIESARVHIVMPEESIFLEEQKPAKASVKIKVKSGLRLSKNEVRGITYLVANSINGLEPDNVTIVDNTGKLLTNPYKDDPTALASSRNIELQTNVELLLQKKIDKLLNGILGNGKYSASVSADLDFDQVQKTLEQYDPESKVVRSEERSETNTKNAPDGDNTTESSTSNYEINKTVQNIIKEVGNIKRLTVAVAVNGKYKTTEDGKREYVPRSPEELSNIESIVKQAVGYDLARGDRITVVNMQFDDSDKMYAQEEQQKIEKSSNITKIVGFIILAIILIIAILMVKSITKSMVDAMNPPLPEVEIPNIVEDEEPVVEIPKDIARSNELLERVEIMTENDPNNVARIIKDWLNDPIPKKE